MKLCTLIAAVSVLVISGCSSSVHPLLTEENFVHDIHLDGTWYEIDTEDTTKRSPLFKCKGFADHSGYNVTLVPGTNPHATQASGNDVPTGVKQLPREYEMRIGKLGEDYYLQLARWEEAPAFLKGVVTYTWAKVALEEDVLNIYPVDDASLEKLLPNSGLAHLMHEPSDLVPDIVITESTEKLQQFLAKHHKELFSKKPRKFRRTGKDGG